MIEKRFGSSDLTSPLVEETKQPHERKNTPVTQGTKPQGTKSTFLDTEMTTPLDSCMKCHGQ